MENLGHFCITDAREGLKIVQFTDIHHWPSNTREWFCEGRNRLINFEKEGYSNKKNVDLIDHVTQRVNPDFAIFTGDILDGRGFKNCSKNSFMNGMRELIAPLIAAKIHWTFIPGNHDDDESPWERKDLLDIYSLPFCASKGAKTFNHTFTIGSTQKSCSQTSIRLWLFDSGANSKDPAIRYTTFSKDSVDGYRMLSKSDNLDSSAVSLAYFHIALPEYEGVAPLVGKSGLFDAALNSGVVPKPWKWEPFTSLVRFLNKDLIIGCSKLNSGIFDAFKEDKNMLATFVGHDHQCDFIARRDGIYLCLGRCGSYTPPHNWEGSAGALPFDQGARVVHFKSKNDITTWICTLHSDKEDEFYLCDPTGNDKNRALTSTPTRNWFRPITFAFSCTVLCISVYLMAHRNFYFAEGRGRRI